MAGLDAVKLVFAFILQLVDYSLLLRTSRFFYSIYDCLNIKDSFETEETRLYIHSVIAHVRLFI